MADFLTRLAARTIGVAPVIRPRIASLYAPTEAGEISGMEENPMVSPQGRYASERAIPGNSLETTGRINGRMISSIAEYAPVTTGETLEVGEHLMTDQESSHTQTASFNLPEPVEQTSKEMVFPVTESSNLQSASIGERTVAPAHSGERSAEIVGGMTQRIPLVEDGIKVVSAAFPKHKPDFSTQQQAVSAHIGPGAVKDESNSEISPQCLTAPTAVRDEGIATQHFTAESESRAFFREGEAAPEVSTSRRVSPGSSGIKVVGRVRQSVEDAQTPQEAVSPTPTVQITIGRIEVRATPAPAARSQTKRPGPSAMGLEEYLKQHAGGGR
jgi:hypothetical protein